MTELGFALKPSTSGQLSPGRVQLGASLLKAGTLDARSQVSCRQEVRRAERRAAVAPGVLLLSRIQSKKEGSPIAQCMQK